MLWVRLAGESCSRSGAVVVSVLNPMISKTQQYLINHKVKFEPSKKWWARYYKLRALFYRSPEWKKLSKQVRDFYKNECQNAQCGKKAFDVHHIITLFENPYLALVWTNLTLLCRSCHKKVHKYNIQPS